VVNTSSEDICITFIKRADEELINYEDKEVIVLEGEDEEEKDVDGDRERDKDGSLLHPFLYCNIFDRGTYF